MTDFLKQERSISTEIARKNFKFNTGNYGAANNSNRKETRKRSTGCRNVPVLAKNTQATWLNICE